VVFASATPDYITPATSCILQDKLRLRKGCAAFDITHPCSGYTYGLWVVANLLSSGNLKRALLLAGDTVSRMVSPQDRSISILVGDAGSATALEWEAEAAPMFFEMGSDGGGYRHLIKKAGGFRHPATVETSRRTEQENGNIRSDEDLFMDGAEIFAFAVREVPPLTEKVLAQAGWSMDDVDSVVMHQANRFMIRHLAKKLNIPEEKHVENLANFGNTSGVSIPRAIPNKLQESLTKAPRRLVLLGFGAGLSWGGVAVSCGPLVIPDLVTVTAADLTVGT
jgi:3-oxoacyl-[acyl-carrier-protein] synthase-3